MKALFLGFILVCGVGFSQNKTDAQGRKQGPWRKYQPGDKILIYTGQFKDDIPVGEFRYYYPSGKVKSIVQHESKRVSYSWFYNESEVLILEGKFVDKNVTPYGENTIIGVSFFRKPHIKTIVCKDLEKSIFWRNKNYKVC